MRAKIKATMGKAFLSRHPNVGGAPARFVGKKSNTTSPSLLVKRTRSRNDAQRMGVSKSTEWQTPLLARKKTSWRAPFPPQIRIFTGAYANEQINKEQKWKRHVANLIECVSTNVIHRSERG